MTTRRSGPPPITATRRAAVPAPTPDRDSLIGRAAAALSDPRLPPDQAIHPWGLPATRVVDEVILPLIGRHNLPPRVGENVGIVGTVRTVESIVPAGHYRITLDAVIPRPEATADDPTPGEPVPDGDCRDATPAADTRVIAFANHVLSDWDSAMDRFFTAVERERQHAGLTVADARRSLNRGYGDEIGDAWAAWNEGIDE